MPPPPSEPPGLVLADPSPCSEAESARALFVEALKPALPPEPGWSVRVQVDHSKGQLKAKGDLADSAGILRAHRDFAVHGNACAPLARAIGVWASLVLDEIRQADEALLGTAPSPGSPPAAKTHGAPGAPTPGGTPNGAGADAKTVIPNAQASDESARATLPETRAFELGVAAFLMNAGNTGARVGGAAFSVIELPAKIFLRPKVSFGKNFGPLQAANDVDKSLGTVRVDACLRIPGHYIDRRGLAIDVCGGGEGGFLSMGASAQTGVASRTLAYGAFGPGIGLRGEFADDFVAEVRAEGLMRIAENLPIGGRAEMALTYRAR